MERSDDMDGIHDLGGMHGFGRVIVEEDEPPFHAPWQARVMGIAYLVTASVGNIDAFRHAIERLDPVTYLTAGYYGRWVVALERVLVESGHLAPGELEARLAETARERGNEGTRERSLLHSFSRSLAPSTSPRPRSAISVIRSVDASPRYALGASVRARNIHPPGHTRLPRYARGKRGVVERVHPACVFPDAHAHGLGEKPEYLYSVRFTGEELWGDDAEPGTSASLDLFESYLEPA